MAHADLALEYERPLVLVMVDVQWRPEPSVEVALYESIAPLVSAARATSTRMSWPAGQTSRTDQTARTRTALVVSAFELLAEGDPEVEQTADRREISLSTAYRYFTNQRELLTAVYPELDTPSLLHPDAPADAGARLGALMRRIPAAHGDRFDDLRALTPDESFGDKPITKPQPGRTAVKAGVRRRFAPHQLPHAHAVEMAHEGVPLVVIQRQLGHANLGITSIYLQGIDSSEIIDTVHSRPAPVIPATAGLESTL